MKFDKPRGGSSNSPAVARTDITKENYLERAKAFAVARGAGYVIRAIEGEKGSAATGERATEPQWLAWMAYFDMKGIEAVFTQAYGVMTVPCEWPEDFDLVAETSDRRALIHRKRDGSTTRHVGIFDGLQRNMMVVASAKPRRRGDPNSSAPKREPMPAELAEKYRANPITLSPATRSVMGIGANETEDAA